MPSSELTTSMRGERGPPHRRAKLCEAQDARSLIHIDAAPPCHIVETGFRLKDRRGEGEETREAEVIGNKIHTAAEEGEIGMEDGLGGGTQQKSNRTISAGVGLRVDPRLHKRAPPRPA